MKFKLIQLISALLLLTFISCNSDKANFHPDGKVILSGKFLNYERHPELKSFNIFYHNLFELQKRETIEIKKNGSFKILFPCHYNMDFFIAVGRTPSTLICSPNDSLFITIDADILNNSKDHYPNDEYFVKVIEGAKENKYVNEFILNKNSKKLSRTEYFETIETKNPLEYFSYQMKRHEKELNVLDSIVKNVKKTGLFIDWAKDLSKYEKIDKLLKYPRIHAKENNVSLDSLFIPKEYFAKTFRMGINGTSMFSFYHSAFFNSYYVYLYKQAKKEKIDVLQFIQLHAEGFSKDMAISRHYISLNKEPDTIVNVNYQLIKNEYLKNLLRSRIKTKNQKKADLFKLKTNSSIADSLFSKYKGNVVYVDFWATWCGPCLKEIPWSMKMHEEFKGKPVVFLFLCNQSKYEDWKKTVKEKEIKGEHVFLHDKEFNELKALFDIGGVPHYLLINKHGGIRNNAPRPSSKIIDSEIQKLLDE